MIMSPSATKSLTGEAEPFAFAFDALE